MFNSAPPHSNDSGITRYQLRWACCWGRDKTDFPETRFFGDGCVAERTFRTNFHRFVYSSMQLVNYYKKNKSFERRRKNKLLSFF